MQNVKETGHSKVPLLHLRRGLKPDAQPGQVIDYDHLWRSETMHSCGLHRVLQPAVEAQATIHDQFTGDRKTGFIRSQDHDRACGLARPTEALGGYSCAKDSSAALVAPYTLVLGIPMWHLWVKIFVFAHGVPPT